MRFQTLMAIAASLILAGCGWSYPRSQFTGKYEGHSYAFSPYAQAETGARLQFAYNVELLSSGDCLFETFRRWTPNGSTNWSPWQPRPDFEPCTWYVLDDGRLEFKLGSFDRIRFGYPHGSEIDYHEDNSEHPVYADLRRVGRFEPLD